MKKQVPIIIFMAIISFLFSDVQYNVIDLGFIMGGTQSHAYSINDDGQIVGVAYALGFQHFATLFDSTGAGKNVCLGGYLPNSVDINDNVGIARSINSLGHIVGEASPGTRATLFDSTGGWDNIDLGGSGSAWSINDSGQIVGRANSHAVLFDPTGKKNNIDLGTLGGTYSQAHSINNNGVVVGMAYDSFSNVHATLFDTTGGNNNIDLGALGGTYSQAFSINDHGQIVGSAGTTSVSGDQHAVLFDSMNGNLDLGTLGGDRSFATSINDLGQIVGNAMDEDDQYHATLFDITGSGQNVSLNTLIDKSSGWNLQYAYDINNNGWIVGYGINPDGYECAYLLTPIPEPCTFLLLGFSVLALQFKHKQ